MAETNSKLIDITRLTEYDAKIKAWAKELDEPIDQEFTTNNTVGALESGTAISKDETLANLIARMLVSVKDVTSTTAPTCYLSNTGTAAGKDYEVGTTISTSLTCSFTDGSFNDSYVAGSNTKTEKIAAGCKPTGPNYTKGGAEYSAESFILEDGGNTITGSYTYGASTVKPKKSDGSDSAKTIAAGSCNSKLTWTGYYNFYEGAVDSIPTEINRTNVSGLNKGAYKTSYSTKMNKKCYMICIPENKTIHVKDTATNADLTGTMTKRTVSIEDAAGRAKTYYMWTCQYASSVGLENNAISITFS